MSLKTLEDEILTELQELCHNKKIKKKDILEWSAGKVIHWDNEKIIQLKKIRVQVCIRKELDQSV